MTPESQAYTGKWEGARVGTPALRQDAPDLSRGHSVQAEASRHDHEWSGKAQSPGSACLQRARASIQAACTILLVLPREWQDHHKTMTVCSISISSIARQIERSLPRHFFKLELHGIVHFVHSRPAATLSNHTFITVSTTGDPALLALPSLPDSSLMRPPRCGEPFVPGMPPV